MRNRGIPAKIPITMKISRAPVRLRGIGRDYIAPGVSARSKEPALNSRGRQAVDQERAKESERRRCSVSSTDVGTCDKRNFFACDNRRGSSDRRQTLASISANSAISFGLEWTGIWVTLLTGLKTWHASIAGALSTLFVRLCIDFHCSPF
jgi:hypothetical protein